MSDAYLHALLEAARAAERVVHGQHSAHSFLLCGSGVFVAGSPEF